MAGAGGTPADGWLARLAELDARSLRRHPPVATAASPAWITIDGRRLANFASNDYLGLSVHPAVTAAAAEAAARWGAGARASRLVSGTLEVHEALEEDLARFKGTEAALVFSSGYMAGLALVATAALRADGTRAPVVFDRLAHACLIDGALAAGGRWARFDHNDAADLGRVLDGLPAADPASGPVPSAVVVTEGVFSMDGDAAPIAALHAVCATRGALLLIDDAHGTGTRGPGGRGSVAAAGLDPRDPWLVQMGTLSKSLGAQGGFVAGPAALIELMKSTARTFLFDTALAPPAAAAARAALALLTAHPAMTDRLRALSRLARAALTTTTGGSEDEEALPIIPQMVGDPSDAAALSIGLRQLGHHVPAIRPPTVPAGTSRLRITINASTPMESIHELAQHLQSLTRETPSPPSPSSM